MAELNITNAQICPGVASQAATVCLPVSIKPYVATGPSCVQCCGDLIMTPCCNHCKGKVNGCCEFTLTQKIRIDLPIEFGASVHVGDTYVDCMCQVEDMCCTPPYYDCPDR